MDDAKMPECACAITVGEVHGGLCLRCRKPTNRRATAAFVSSSTAGPISEASSRPEPDSDGRGREFDYFQRMLEAEKRRAREIELRHKLKNR